MPRKTEAQISFEAKTEQFNANIKKSESTLRELRSELRLNATEMEGGGDKATLLKDRLSILAQEQETAKQKTENVSAKLEEAKKTFGENSRQVEIYATQLNNAKNVEASIQNEIGRTTQSLKEQESASSKLSQTVAASDQKIESLNQELETNRVKLDGVSQETSDFKSKLEGASDKTTLLKERQELLEKQLTESKTKTDALKEALDSCGKEAGENSKEYETLKTKLNAAEREQAEIQNEIRQTNTTLMNQKTALQLAGEEFEGFGSKIKSAAKVAVAAIAAIGIAFSTATALSVKAGIEFESAFTGVIKTVDATEEEIADLRAGLLEMSGEIPASASALSEIAEAAGQLGIETENIKGFTEVMANLGVSTNMEATEAATSLARFANVTGMAQTEFERLGSTVVALGNNYATTESEITEMGQRLAAAGSQINLSEATIMSFAAALSSVGIEAEAGGSAFSKVMSNMQLAVEKGGDSLNDFANVAGMSASQFQTAFKQDAAGAILSFIQGLSTAEERGVSAIKVLDDMEITEIRMRNALLSAAGASDMFSEAIKTGSQAWEDNTALTKEAETRYGTLESKTQLLKNAVSNLGISIYDNLKGTLSTAAEAGTKAVGKLQTAFERGGLSGAVSAAGGILNSFFNEVTKGNPTLKKALTPIKNIATAVGKLGKTVLPVAVKAFGFLTDNLNKFVPLALAGVAAVKGYAIATAIATKVSALVKAFQATTVAIQTATTATQAFNAVTSMSPIGLITAAVAALTIGIGALVIMQDKSNTAMSETEAKLQQTEDSINQNAEAWEELKAAEEEHIATEMALVGNTQNLWSELQNITDENGKIQEGYEKRAAFIVGELSNALGIEIEIIDGTIQKYDELSVSIDKLIAQKRAEAVLAAKEEGYKEAITNKEQALTDATNARAMALAQMNKVTELSNEIAELESSWLQASKEGRLEDAEALQYQLEAKRGNLEEQESLLARSEAAYNNAAAVHQNYCNNIETYEALATAAATGSAEEIISALSKVTSGFELTSDTTRTELEEQIRETEAKLETLNALIDAGYADINNTTVQETKRGLEESLAEYNTALPTIAETGAKAGGTLFSSYVAKIKESIYTAKDAGIEMGESAKDGAESVDAKPAGEDFIDGYVTSLKNGTSSIWTAAANIGKAAIAAVKAAQDSHSPSKEAAYLGDMFAIGYINPLIEGANKAAEAGKNLGLAALDGVESGTAGMLDSINGTMSLSTAISGTDSLRMYIEDSIYRAVSNTPAIDYDELARAMSKQEIKVVIGDREAGRIVRRVLA